MTRRTLLSGVAAAAAATQAGRADTTAAPGKLKVAIFSKHLQFLRGEALAQAVADMGYDGIDLSVRKGGHVEPDRVQQDLPAMVKLIRGHGLQVPMITTDIADTSSPFAEEILRAMAELDIRHYRWGSFKYTAQPSLAQQLEALKPRVAKLAALNAKYKVGAMYHTHSGIDLVGAPIWDLHELVQGLDPALVGINYDIGHATIEGGFGGWIDSFRICGAHLQGIAVKDFVWEKDAKTGNWRSRWKPLGEGMVRFRQFFEMVAAARFQGPLQLHFEYPLGGADGGKTTLTMPQSEVFAAMKQDLGTLRGYLREANLA